MKNMKQLIESSKSPEEIVSEAGNPAQAVKDFYDLWALIKDKKDAEYMGNAMKELEPKKRGMIQQKVEALYKELYKL